MNDNPDPNPPVLIIGAGLCGLSAACGLESAGFGGYTVLEGSGGAGGLAGTDTRDGFSFDRCIHLLFTKDPAVLELFRSDPGTGLVRHARRSYCRAGGLYTGFPYQQHNYGLPLGVKLRNIAGLVRARLNPGPEPANYEEWICRAFGEGIAANCMLPYSRRLWAWDLRDMAWGWAASHMPVPTVRDTVLGAFFPRGKGFGQTSEFLYPERGGIGALAASLLARIPAGKVRLNARVKAVSPARREVTLQDGTRLRYSKLVSTMPLPDLIAAMGAEAPAEMRDRAAGLRCNTIHTVNIGLRGELSGQAAGSHWTYFIEDDAVFHRLGFPHNLARSLVPAGCSSIQAEISESALRPRNRAALAAETLRDLVKHGILGAKEALPEAQGGRVLFAGLATYAPAYVIYDHQHAANTAALKAFLESNSILTRGRFGEWEYYNMDRAVLSGLDAARAALKTA